MPPIQLKDLPAITGVKWCVTRAGVDIAINKSSYTGDKEELVKEVLKLQDPAQIGVIELELDVWEKTDPAYWICPRQHVNPGFQQPEMCGTGVSFNAEAYQKYGHAAEDLDARCGFGLQPLKRKSLIALWHIGGDEAVKQRIIRELTGVDE